MSIFSSVEKHDLQYEHELMRQKFTVVAGEYFGKWQVIELKPKLADAETYKRYCSYHIISITYLTHRLYAEISQTHYAKIVGDEWATIENEFVEILNKLKVEKLIFPEKNVLINEYKPIILYAISQKQMNILQEKMCSYILLRKHNS